MSWQRKTFWQELTPGMILGGLAVLAVVVLACGLA